MSEFMDRAKAEAAKRWPFTGKPNKDMEPLDWFNEGMGCGFVLGAQWAVEQEATDE